MHLWSQLVSLTLAGVGFGVSLVPRHYREEDNGSAAFRLVMWPRLLRFPIFWLGLILLVLVTIQALNPSWRYTTDGKAWWMTRIPNHITWLPLGVDVPFRKGGPWRQLIIYASVWLTACTLWVGFTRRRVLQTLLIVLAGNGVLLAAFGVVQRTVGNGKIFWTRTSSNDSFFASFIYKNHAGGYLLLMLATCAGFAAWYYRRSLRRLEKSNPAALFAFFSLAITVAIFISYARGATMIMGLFLVGFAAAFIGHQLMRKHTMRALFGTVALVAIFGLFLKTGLETVQSREAWTRLMSGLNRQDQSLEAREWATAAAGAMLADHWKSGVGAGSFQFLFPIYQHRDPRLVSSGGAPMFWDHAHNDLLEVPIELGLTGIGVLVAMAGYVALTLVRSAFWRNPLSGSLVFGTVLLVVYARWDFPLQCPAILVTCCTLVVASALWARFEHSATSSQSKP